MKILFKAAIGDVIVDDADYEILSKFSWSLDSRGYPIKTGRLPRLLLHRILLGRPPQGLVTDHINRNKLDNRRENLRFATRQQNAINKFHDDLYSIYPTDDKFRVRFSRGRRIHLGCFNTLEEAKKIRDAFLVREGIIN